MPALTEVWDGSERKPTRFSKVLHAFCSLPVQNYIKKIPVGKNENFQLFEFPSTIENNNKTRVEKVENLQLFQLYKNLLEFSTILSGSQFLLGRRFWKSFWNWNGSGNILGPDWPALPQHPSSNENICSANFKRNWMANGSGRQWDGVSTGFMGMPVECEPALNCFQKGLKWRLWKWIPNWTVAFFRIIPFQPWAYLGLGSPGQE